MPNVHRLLPRLTVNRRLLQAIVDERRACCALGLAEERKQLRPAIILGLPQVQDLAQLGDGFRLGHQVAFAGGVQALRLDFLFQGLTPLQAVLDPTNATVARVLAAIVESDAFFILAVGAHGLTAFRADTAEGERRQFDDLLRRTTRGVTGTRQFSRLASALQTQASEAESLVCLGLDDPSLLHLSEAQRYELRPAH